MCPILEILLKMNLYIEELDLRVDCIGHTLYLATKRDDCGSDNLIDNQLF